MSFQLNDAWREILLLCFLCFGPIQSASAEEKPNAISSSSVESFGTVWRISGSVTASGRAQIQSRELHQGDTVFVGELLKSAPTGEAVLNTQDKGMIAVRPNTEFLAEFYSAEGKSSDGYTIRLLTGSLRVISGWISHINRSRARIVTPSATIGIRGTDH